MKGMVVCIDVGGTFVDLALFCGSHLLRVEKVLNRPAHPADAVLEGTDTLLADVKGGYGAIDSVIYSTTLAINAIIQRRGTSTALVCTEGFRDALEVRTELPYDLYNPFAEFPEPLVPRALRLGLNERTLADGTIQTRPGRADIERIADTIAKKGAGAVAVSLLHSYANPENERMVGEILSQRLPHVTVSLSSDVLPEVGEYGRTSTVVTNAYLLKIVGQHLDELNDKLKARGFVGRLRAVTSAGGMIEQETAARFPVKLLESGPAAGSVGIANMIGGDLVTFDMGGTTAKTSFLNGGEPQRSSDYEAGRIERFRRGSGLLVKVPTIDIVEIGAGGGSIAHIDQSGALAIGPESASSSPGPVCYGIGGELPTVTDADLVLGYLNPENFLGGVMALDGDRARDAIASEVGEPLGLDATDAALSIYKVVNAHMAQALGVHAAERGINLHRRDMVALGGAGPVHAYAVAEAVGISAVVVPADAGVLSAVGCRAVPASFEAVGTYRGVLREIVRARLTGLFDRLRKLAVRHAGDNGDTYAFDYEVDVQYVGQRSVLVVPFTCSGKVDDTLIASIEAGFEDAYRLRYGRIVSGVDAEAVTWRIRARAESAPDVRISRERPQIQKAASQPGRRTVVFEREGPQETTVLQRSSLLAGQVIEGPALVEDTATTIVIPPNASCTVGDDLSARIDLAQRIAARMKENEAGTRDTELLASSATIGVYWGKLVSIAEESATALVRTAFSRIVTEARDYSCVLCDAKGELISQSLQGLPEFVNSLAEAVPQFLKAHPPEELSEGDVLVSNDPLICTSQMNDFVVVKPIWHRGRIVAYAANVSHSPDVGGRLLGTEAREIFEEGLRLPISKLFEKGQLNELIVSILKANSRVPEVMIGDLMAQVAANSVTEGLMLDFLKIEGLADIDLLAEEIKNRSEQTVNDAIRRIPTGTYTGSVTMDGLDRPLTISCAVSVSQEPPSIAVDFEGTSPQTGGSLNCYLNYIRAEVAYSLLTVLQPGTHINSGSLRPFSVSAPEACLVNAKHPAAVGARSLVVQYVVPAIYNALANVVPGKVLAEPAAPVWPILISGEKPRGGRFVDILFLNGGLGARPNGDGVLIGFPAPVVSSKVELLESEMPFVVQHSELIRGTGGNGAFRGGDGQTFVLKCTSSKPVNVLLRTERLKHAPRGLEGGGDGSVGRVELNGVVLAGKESLWLAQGDVLWLQTAGGGGYGQPSARPEKLLRRDRENGYASE